MLSAQRVAHRKWRRPFRDSKRRTGTSIRGDARCAGEWRRSALLDFSNPSLVSVERAKSSRPDEGRSLANRPRGRITGSEQPPRGDAIAEIEPIGKDSLDAQMIRERPHNVIEPLAYQHHFRAGSQTRFQLDSLRAASGAASASTRNIPRPADRADRGSRPQNGVQQARGENAIRDVEERPRNSENAHGPAARPPPQKALRVPGKERRARQWPCLCRLLVQLRIAVSVNGVTNAGLFVNNNLREAKKVCDPAELPFQESSGNILPDNP